MLVAMLIQDMLVAIGHTTVGPIARREAALKAAASEPLDAALLDVNLDGQEVFPVAEALSARGIPLAFVTGYGGRGLLAPWRGRPILEKPFRQADLGRILDQLLGAA